MTQAAKKEESITALAQKLAPIVAKRGIYGRALDEFCVSYWRRLSAEAGIAPPSANVIAALSDEIDRILDESDPEVGDTEVA